MPLIIEQFLAATIGIADTLMVSGVGEVAVSGVSLVDSINVLLLQVFAALATGGAIIAAQYLGRDDVDDANMAAKQLLVVTTIFSAAIMGICLLWKEQILFAMFGAAEAAVMENALVYFWISAFSYPLISLYNVGAALFRVQGNSRISMLAALLMNITNIGFNAWFIYGMDMGAAGAALGSLISRGFGAAFLLLLLHNHNNRVYLYWDRSFRLQKDMVRNILRIGIPNGIENGMFHIGKLLVAGLIATFGTVAITANAVGNSVMTMIQIPGSAVGLAIVTVIGQCVGAQDYRQAKRYTKLLMGISYGTMLVTTLGSVLIMRQIIGLFGALTAQTAQAAWEVCVSSCIVEALIWPSSFTLPNALRAAGDVRFTMITSAVSMWAFRIGMSYVLGSWMHMGLMGVWVAMYIDWAVRSAFFIVRMISGKWMKIKVI